jgi:hypothetical protein
MNRRPYLQFYKAILQYVAAFTLISAGFLGIVWGFVFFNSLALAFGFFGFNSFYKEQRYTYQNLGITKWQLLRSSFVINLIISIPIILFILISMIIGDFSLT